MVSSEDILLEAKILAVADVVEAMSSHRPHRLAKSIDRVLEEIKDNRGVLYDPKVVDTCLMLFDKQGLNLVRINHKILEDKNKRGR